MGKDRDRLTKWLPPGELMRGQWGEQTTDEWMRAEARRLTTSDRRVTVERCDGMVALVERRGAAPAPRK